MEPIKTGDYVRLKNSRISVVCKVLDLTEDHKLAVQECKLVDSKIEDDDGGCIYVLNERDSRYQLVVDRVDDPLVAYYHIEKEAG